MRAFDSILKASDGRPLEAAAAPARGAVVLLSDAAGRPVLLATTADARAFLRKRLNQPVGGEAEAMQAGPSARADLSAIVASASLLLVGSGLEADLAFLAIARAAMPETWQALTERWRAWFVHLDPDAPNPVWRKTNLAEAGLAGASPGHIIGPVLAKDTAGRLGEILDDLFDLCRFPKELALAPRGTACAYKEMGKCPAPCDGSEPMASYRGRVREALVVLGLDPAARAAPIDAAMREAAADHDFERAARHKAQLDRLEQLGKPSLREARPLDGLRMLAVLGSGRPGWARAWLIDPCSCQPIADVDGAHPKRALAELESIVRDRPQPTGIGPPDPVLLGIIARHLLAPAPKRRGGFVRIGPGGGFDAAAVGRLVRAAARTDGGDVEEFDRATLG